MLFNSYVFVFAFLPIVLYLWWHPRGSLSARLLMLTAASYFFYGWWDYRFVGLLFGSTLVDYTAGRYIASSQTGYVRRAALTVSLCTNLGLLAVFKYCGFFAQSINAVATAIQGTQPLPVFEMVLPVGISFYTFQTMSYSIDIYRRQAKPADSLLHFAAYVSMFPQLVAGPIVRYGYLENQLRNVPLLPDWPKLARGVFFCVMGLGQKLLLADVIAQRIDPMLLEYESLELFGSWFAMLGYSLQLYFDFAGYSNMAVGLGLLLGFEFPQNFESPYKSTNISIFWRRWHMTLSQWLRDYLFLPLGGSQVGRWLTLRNLVIVMFLGGLWHGAGWTFVCWGLFHGLLLVVHRLFQQRFPTHLPRPFAIALTFIAVVFSWVLFRSVDLAMAGDLFASMFGLNGIEANGLKAVGGGSSVALISTLAAIVFAVPNLWQIRFRPTRGWALVLATILIACVLRFDHQSPFLYFQF